ncbi:hypothetical protein RB594_000263 [Gaeumannomyces avenae]
MVFSLSNAVALLGLAATAAASYIPQHVEHNGTTAGIIEKRAFSCSSPVRGLAKADCEHMSKIGMAGQGYNPTSQNSIMWIGTQGPNKFKFINRSSPSCPINIIVWHMKPNDFESSFMNVRRPRISYTLAKAGDSVTVSVPNGISGGWAGLYNRNVKLSSYGQIYNTWGEFTTGQYGTVDVSRLVRMNGNPMSIKTSGGCTSNMNKCVFVCKSGNTCGTSGSYNLKDCKPGSQPHANYGTRNGNPEGGCQGFSNGGTVTVDLSR